MQQLQQIVDKVAGGGIKVSAEAGTTVSRQGPVADASSSVCRNSSPRHERQRLHRVSRVLQYDEKVGVGRHERDLSKFRSGRWTAMVSSGNIRTEQ